MDRVTWLHTIIPALPILHFHGYGTLMVTLFCQELLEDRYGESSI